MVSLIRRLPNNKKTALKVNERRQSIEPKTLEEQTETISAQVSNETRSPPTDLEKEINDISMEKRWVGLNKMAIHKARFSNSATYLRYTLILFLNVKTKSHAK